MNIPFMDFKWLLQSPNKYLHRYTVRQYWLKS